ncbi:MAG: hypothetical protein WDM77_21655 [Steroidobacteraceae bacterium]
MAQSWAGEEIATLMSQVFARPVRFEAIQIADWPQDMTETWGVAPELAKGAQGTAQAIEDGEFDLVSEDYPKIAGRAARTLREFLEGVRDKAAL